MAIHPVTLNLPTELYERLQRRADAAHRSVEDELLDAVAATVPGADDLHSDL
jgi:plasmid stability protein